MIGARIHDFGYVMYDLGRVELAIKVESWSEEGCIGKKWKWPISLHPDY